MSNTNVVETVREPMSVTCLKGLENTAAVLEQLCGKLEEKLAPISSAVVQGSPKDSELQEIPPYFDDLRAVCASLEERCDQLRAILFALEF